MKKSFEVLNIKCGGCANTVKKKLADKFGDIDVNLDTMPRIVTVDINNDEDEEYLKSTLRSLGYPLVGDNVGSLEKMGLKAKSFVSCAIGKMTQE